MQAGQEKVMAAMIDHVEDDSNVPARSGWAALLANRLLLALLAVSLIPMAFMGIASQRSASEALRDQAFKQLETVNTITGQSVERYFRTLHDELRVLSDDRMVAAALREFTAATVGLVADDGLDDKELARARRSLESFYTGEFAAAYRKATGTDPDSRALVATLDDTAVALQDLYIRGNEYPFGQKAGLDAADDASAYTKSHAIYHPIFRNLKEKYGLYDMFLMDATTGRIVYSVCKEIDFAAPLRTGLISGTNLRAAFEEAVTAGTRDAVAYAPFERYLPSLMQPASFIAAPVFDGRELVGVVAFQIPLDRVSEIIGETTGMGTTGETYAVGADLLFRSESRFTSDLGVASTVLNPDLKVDTLFARRALEDGKSGTDMGLDYRGKPVLSSWRPVTIHADTAGGRRGVRWALISEIDQSEVFAPINRLWRFGLAVFGLTALGVLAVSTLIARRLSRESERQARLVHGIIDNTHAMASASEELTSVSQQMSAAAEQTTAQANLVSAAAEQVSGNANMVSGSIDNLVTSIHEIAKSAQDAAGVARRAVDMAGTTSSTMDALGRSSSEIGAVVKVITSIAEQTNLLALNATIEAARAGEAGKGFAVVANEVKELARETAKATEDIGGRIDSMQSETQRAVAAIAEIGSVIGRIDELQTRIAAAVEEQSATTGEISRNITEATTGSSEIAENIVQVAQAAQSTAEGASNTQVSSQELARMAQALQRLVDEYRK
jgi:methyl-accepting chemotaxis protein